MSRQPDPQDKLRQLMKASSAGKRKAAPSLSKHQLRDDLKKLKKVAGESARSTMVESTDAPAPDLEKEAISSKADKIVKDLSQLTAKDKTALPDGFFDDKKREHKVRMGKGAKDIKREEDAEMKKYMEEIEAEELRQEESMQKNEHEDQVKRELDDAKFQIHLYKQADKLADKFEVKAARLRQKRKEEEDKLSGKIEKLINNQFSDNDSDEESDEEADWRSRELF